ncbi:GntR family transcriptional regulator [bacterium]|nr:GntR family transcriptional regulator [bacterium]
MLIKIDPKSGVPMYLQIMEQVRYAVATETIGQGEVMPSIRQLALELRINPNTVARAYRDLEREGILETRQGQGTVVAAASPKLVRQERYRIMREMLSTVLARAHNLGMNAGDIIELIEEMKGAYGLQSADDYVEDNADGQDNH